jgi:DNA-binding beta-propeller fold protein YncE
MFDGEGRFVRQFGSKGSGDGQLQYPRALGLDDRQGHVYVSDHLNHRVCVFDVASGGFVRSFGHKGSGDGQLDHPFGLSLDVAGQLVYVGDYKNKRVAIFTMGGGWVGSVGAGRLRSVGGVAVDKAGTHLAVVDWNEGGGPAAPAVQLLTLA